MTALGGCVLYWKVMVFKEDLFGNLNVLYKQVKEVRKLLKIMLIFLIGREKHESRTHDAP
jgi:hypothetical protein